MNFVIDSIPYGRGKNPLLYYQTSSNSQITQNYKKMSAKTPSLKTYEYHFRDVHKTHRSPQFGLVPQLPVSHKNIAPKILNTNHRYSYDWPTTQEKDLGITKDSSKPSLGSDRYSQPLTKYTFSVLAAEQKQFRKSEDFELTKIGAHQNKNTVNHTIRTLNKDYSSPLFAKSQLNGIEDLREQQNNNKKVCGVAVRKGSKEFSDPQRECHRLEAELRRKHTENQQCKQIANMLKAQITEKDVIIKNYVQQVAALAGVIASQQQTITKLCKETENIKKPAKLKLDSKVISHCLEEQDGGDENFKKHESNSTITYNYEEDYKQVLQMFGVQPSEEHYHQILIQQIEKVKKSLDQMTNRVQVMREKERENGKLVHYCKKMQSDNIKLAHLNSFLSEEITKYCLMIDQSNEQIQAMHLRRLNERFNQQTAL